ncbi:MAG: hypothetical protein JNL97_06685 [Verrucomicrobiales bacterium]|nr:hypothetical protein [Verrucomicrobiales bacterium]
MPPPRPRPPIFVLLFFAMFGFIGLTLLGSLWSRSGFGMEPPAIFRIVGSFIALMFVLVGFGVPLSALKAARRFSESPDSFSSPTEREGTPETPTKPPVGYRCPNCGAQLGPDQEVSPSGDTKCTYCKRWWNIHRATG